jgi:ubiquinone/menaquinone biosynthesis C-methylase UbiE
MKKEPATRVGERPVAPEKERPAVRVKGRSAVRVTKDPALPTCEEFAAHYEALLADTKVYEPGMLNATEEPVPRPARYVRDTLTPSVVKSFRGFNTPLPGLIDGCRVLLLGCGTGRDAFVASKLVGARGRVLAVDPSPGALREATKATAGQMARFGRTKANVEFVQGYPEDLASLGVRDASCVVVLTNYSLNLALDKQRVIDEAYRVLRFGGELYLGALFSDRRITETLLEDPRLKHAILRGAIYLEDFRRWLRSVGWESFRYMQKRRVVIADAREREALGDTDLVYRVVRAFKLDNLEDLCENYGQSLEYLGTAAGYNQFFDLDDKHRFFVDKPIRVCGNTCALVENTRFSPYFRIKGSRDGKHFGLYTYCPYCGFGKEEHDIIEYLEEEKPVCADCSHKGFCAVDGHCQHEG